MAGAAGGAVGSWRRKCRHGGGSNRWRRVLLENRDSKATKQGQRGTPAVCRRWGGGGRGQDAAQPLQAGQRQTALTPLLPGCSLTFIQACRVCWESSESFCRAWASSAGAGGRAQHAEQPCESGACGRWHTSEGRGGAGEGELGPCPKVRGSSTPKASIRPAGSRCSLPHVSLQACKLASHPAALPTPPGHVRHAALQPGTPGTAPPPALTILQELGSGGVNGERQLAHGCQVGTDGGQVSSGARGFDCRAREEVGATSTPWARGSDILRA